MQRNAHKIRYIFVSFLFFLKKVKMIQLKTLFLCLVVANLGAIQKKRNFKKVWVILNIKK
jgi:hypothetical protein